MKAKITLTLKDDISLDVHMENPGEVDLYTLIGMLEKVKGELIIGSPPPITESGEEEE